MQQNQWMMEYKTHRLPLALNTTVGHLIKLSGKTQGTPSDPFWVCAFT